MPEACWSFSVKYIVAGAVLENFSSLSVRDVRLMLKASGWTHLHGQDECPSQFLGQSTAKAFLSIWLDRDTTEYG